MLYSKLQLVDSLGEVVSFHSTLHLWLQLYMFDIFLGVIKSDLLCELYIREVDELHCYFLDYFVIVDNGEQDP